MTEEIPLKEIPVTTDNPAHDARDGEPQPGDAARTTAAPPLPREEAIRRLDGLNRLARLIDNSGRDVERLLHSVARMLSESIGDMSTISLLSNDKTTYRITAYYDRDPKVVALFEQVLADSPPRIDRGQGWVAKVIHTGEPLLIPGITVEQVVSSAVPSFVEFTRQVGIASLLIVPVRGRGGVLGAIAITRHEGGRPYNDYDRDFLLEIAGRTGVAVENFMLIESLRNEVSARLFAREALAASEQRFLSIFQSAALGIKVMDLVGTVLETNPAFQRISGYPESELIAMHFYDIVHPEDVAKVMDEFSRLRITGAAGGHVQHRIIRRDGSVVWVRTTFAGVRKRAENQALSLIFGLTEDLTEQKQTEADILELKQHLQRSIEMERLRIAQNLHDAPLQELYVVIYKLEELRLGVSPEAAKLLAEVIADIQYTLNSLRSTASELRPPALSRFGLEKAVRSYMEELREQHPEIQLKLSLARDRQSLPEPVRLVLFRTLQEAMSNILRHSQATQVSVRFSFDAEEARLEISDNGVGFAAPSNAVSLVREGHYGLAGMWERVTAASGSLSVESEPGKGTVIRAVVPCMSEE
ncbi:MAG: PAS domain S-box protein [Anaerolineae bacterium]